MSKVRIAHIITELDTGGAETMLANLLSRMDRNSFEAEVISLVGRGPIAVRIEAMGIPVRVLGMKRGRASPSGLFRLARWLREGRPRLIQTWMYHANLAGGLAAKLAGGIPVIWGIHASHLDRTTTRRSTLRTVKMSAPLSRWLPKRIVYCSEVSHGLHKSLGYAEDRTLVIPNGFDVEAFTPNPQARAEVRAELGVLRDTPLIGMVARLHPQKDHNNFFKAAALLNHDLPEARFVLCGSDVTPENAAVQSWVAQNSLTGRCHILGRRSDIARLMCSFDIMSTASSYGEAFPMVVGEAMACSVPCVVTDIGDSSLIVGKTGHIVPARDPVALAGAWGEILRRSAEERHRLGEAARARIVELYSLDSIAARYASLYHGLLE